MKAAVEISLKLLLAPILIWQGLRVRKHALILPEATGPRSGITGKGAPLRLLILGDSSAAGVGVETQDMALLGQLVSRLSGTCEVHWDLVAKTGATTTSTIETARTLDPKPYDGVIVALGVNDVTRSVPLKHWISLHRTLFDHLIATHGAQRIYTSTLPPMGHFPVLPQPLRWLIGLTATRYNAAMTDWQATRPEVTRLHFDLPLDPGLMASDGFHPGAEVYAIWADMLAQEISRDFPQVSGGKRTA